MTNDTESHGKPARVSRPRRGNFAKTRIRRRTKPGAAPGQLIVDPEAYATGISVIAYRPEEVKEIANARVEDIARLRQEFPIIWVDVVGLKDVSVIEKIGADFHLHPLALEDVLNVHQRAKAEDYDSNLFIVLRMVRPGHSSETEQVSVFLGDGFVITFQEQSGDAFGMVRERLRRKGSAIRQSGADYLVYALIDSVIDACFPALEALGERLEALEHQVVRRPEPEAAEGINLMKHELLALRRAIWPHREMLNVLTRHDNRLISAQTGLYLRDCYDHTVQLMDIVETYREIASGLLDMHLSSLSNRMNEIIKVLTIIATIFIPLSFIASLYGMNFDPDASPWNMPELRWGWGYPFALAVMAATALGLLYFFWRRGWIGGKRRE